MSADVERIQQEVARLGISRLCHFTPLQNFVQIVRGEGVASTQQLNAKQRAAFTPQDRERMDGHPDHISCSIQYPNSYYMTRKKGETALRTALFADWVCLFIRPDHLWRPDTRFCAHNAAVGYGRNVRGGLVGFTEMFAASVVAPKGTWNRSARLPDSCPTDAQAEVLVNRLIPLSDITGIAVPTAAAAGNTYAALDLLGAPKDDLPIVMAPALWKPAGLSAMLRQGLLPDEQTWHPAHRDDPDPIAT